MRRVRHQTSDRHDRLGFTLMEVLLVLAILGVIIGLVLPNLIGSQRTALIKATRLQIKGIESAAELYAVDHGGQFPTSVDALLSNPGGDEAWKGPYLKESQAAPLDPWGGPIMYTYPGTNHAGADRPDISSRGPDKLENTADDVNNWQKQT